ncbi:hyoscyamine 6-dioxygenase [Sporothrix schenckii 1099-18]|uniref:Hyoscyamine 6-dioxygenase n=1 Tax=Sporothrix schenckii 1099-18 TaxID=1397361 RepID=A0A0F2MDE4_SPOSC|nr:hyoscyamine 6-dioxygenase [Sporothrix schenckii 1099-18]KJR86880.1 hyoscyamine 6-dioxygenase [Sporothrix schenckii 1099-18]
MAFREIPTIDLAWADDPVRRPELLAGLRNALVDVGFLYVANHGVPDQTVDDMVKVLSALFALPDEAKDAINLRNSPHFLGYSATGAETTAGQADRREQVEFATERTANWTPDKPVYERLRGPNQWPKAGAVTVPGTDRDIRTVVEAYLDALTALGARFLQLVAEALDLPPDALQPFLSDQHRLKLVRYPGLEGYDGVRSKINNKVMGGVQGVGPHKDSSGWWTFLLQASPPPVGGLQALNRAGQWIDVPAVPGTFVVNIGQAFEVVTHGVCPATTHRVEVLPGTPERFSVPFFQGVRRDLTKAEALGLRTHFETTFPERFLDAGVAETAESAEGRQIDSAFLRGRYDTWGESQLRTKVRSHRDVGQRFYADVYDKYIHDEDVEADVK